MPGLLSQRLLLCPLTVAVCSQWMPGINENNHHYSYPNIHCYVPWQSQFVLVGCLAFMKINARTLSQRLLLWPQTVAVCSRWMPGVYFHKRQDSFPNIYCYVPWQSQFVLDGCLAFMKINARTLSQRLLLWPQTVAVCSRWMPGVYFHKHHYSYPNIHCYVPWQSQFVLDGCLAFMKINARTLSQCLLLWPQTVTVYFRCRPSIYFHKLQDFLPNIYSYVPWQSQFIFDVGLAFILINSRICVSWSSTIGTTPETLLGTLQYAPKHW